jgi:general nucleoside transport system permease protein
VAKYLSPIYDKGLNSLKMKVELQKKQLKLLSFAPYMSAGFAFLIGAIVLSFSGVDPMVAYGVMIKGAFGSIRGIADTLVKTTSLLLTGLAVALAFKCRIWNIGAEGQLYMGALGAALAGISVIGAVPILGVTVALITGFIFGASIGLVPAVLKVKLGVNEIIVTVLLNFIVLLFIAYLLHGPIKAPGFNPYSPEIFPQSQLPIILSHTRLHAGIIIAALVSIAMYLLLSKTKIGFEIKSVGANIKAARYAGMNVSKSILVVMGISGGVAGLAGAILVTGVQHYLIEGISPGYGFIAVIAALLGRQHPIGVAIVAFFFAALISGSEVMYRTLGIPSSFAPTLQALVLIFVLIGELFTRLPITKRGSVI